MNHQTRTAMAQNKDQLLEEQITPLAGTAQNFLPNNGSPSNAKEDASTRCSTFGTYAFCFFCIIAGFFIFAFALFLLPGRGRDSLHSTYGFRDGRGKSSSPKRKARAKSAIARPEIDVLSPASVINAYYICHDVADCLDARGFAWEGAKKGKKKKKKKKS
ncbi:unnamed protein product [Adineta steineri]|uniref:Uncharacterized protein n=1 Tax=Adineta steineri TaxID=433720 RepID=A0A813PSS9_9BILA|nr:unnamed protein product [Adineta steineri]